MKLYISFILICFSIGLTAQESEVTVNHEGKDFNQLKHTWKAQWITHPTASTLDYGVFLFRKSFNLEKIPETCTIHISADNRYRLYVNGQYVTFGPSIGDIDHYRYESVDIAPYLKKGNNALAAEVVNFGEYRRAAQQSFQTAFILQGEEEELPDIDINTGTADWKVVRNDAYECIPFTSDSLRAYYSAGPGEYIDAQRYPWGWQEAEYDDAKWLDPKAGTVEFAVGRGFLYGSTWFLVPREIPFMKEEKQRFNNIERPGHLKNMDGFQQEGKTTTIPANTEIAILLDNKNHTTGYPELTISGGKGSEIKITYAEAMYRPYSSTSEEAKKYPHDLKGDRNQLDEKYIFGYYDRIIADGGLMRSYKPLSRKTFRFVQFDIQTGKEALVLEDYYNIYTAYPFEEKAAFRSDDKSLDEIWDAAWLTNMNSCEENFFDPYYEQLQYIGDTRIEALVSIYVSGDDRLMRKAIRQFDDSRLPNGLTQSRYPSYIVQVIPPYSLLWIQMIHDYFIYRNDPAFVEEFLPGMQTVLDWFARRVDDNGMLSDLEWWNFTDWSPGFTNGIPPGADDGHSANISLQYVIALQKAVEIYEFFGLEAEAKKYSGLEKTVREAVMELCYDAEKGLVAETPAKEIFSQHSNIWAILGSAFPEKQNAEVMKKVLADEQLIQSTIYFKFYLVRALQEAGMGDLYLEMLDPWRRMLEMGMTTFGEKDIAPRSECHGWSASPCFDFLHTVSGIYPAAPGFEKVIIAPNFGQLDAFDVDFPHPAGMLNVELKVSKKGKLSGEITLPEGIKGVLLWKGTEISLHPGRNSLD